MTILVIGSALVAACIITTLVAIIRAPLGWEDSAGFHTGVPQISPMHLPRHAGHHEHNQVPELRRVGEGAVDLHNEGITHA